MTYLVDIMENVVSKVSAKLLTQLQTVDPLISGVHFEYGHYTDIRERLTTKSQSAEVVNRYPLIALFEDFRIRKGKAGLEGVTNLKMIILYPSKADVTRKQRETNVFRPILYPIYERLLIEIKNNGNFNVYDQIKHDQINRPHWGDPALYSNDSYLFGDVLDGIEIDNLELETFLENLC